MSTTVVIRPGKLTGAVTPPPSKSQAHRLIIAAALAQGESRLENVDLSQDIRATLGCMEALGADWSLEDRTLTVQGFGGEAQLDGQLPHFDCGESGSTLRFLIPIALAAAGGGVFTGHGRLMQRPQKPYFDLFDQKGIFYEQKDGVLTVRSRLTPGEYALPGDVSSQFITGLLYALPLVEGGLCVHDPPGAGPVRRVRSGDREGLSPVRPPDLCGDGRGGGDRLVPGRLLVWG